MPGGGAVEPLAVCVPRFDAVLARIQSAADIARHEIKRDQRMGGAGRSLLLVYLEHLFYSRGARRAERGVRLPDHME